MYELLNLSRWKNLNKINNEEILTMRYVWEVRRHNSLYEYNYIVFLKKVGEEREEKKKKKENRQYNFFIRQQLNWRTNWKKKSRWKKKIFYTNFIRSFLFISLFSTFISGAWCYYLRYLFVISIIYVQKVIKF
jgi:hypothetical protein